MSLHPVIPAVAASPFVSVADVSPTQRQVTRFARRLARLRAPAGTVAVWGLAVFAAGCFPNTDRLFEDVEDTTVAEDSAATSGDSEADEDGEEVSGDSTVTGDDTTIPDDVADAPEVDGAIAECTVVGDCPASPCSSARCDGGRCVSMEIGGPCDDGDPCTTQDTCVAGACVGRAWTAAESTGWLAAFDGPGTDMANALVAHPSGDVSVVGSFEGTASLAGAWRTARGEGGQPDAFAARLDASGALKWVAQDGGPGLDVTLYAVADGEDLVAAGWFSETATFGAGANEVAVTASGELGQSFLARYGPTGALIRLWRFPGFIRALAVPEDGSGDLIVAGLFREQVVFAGIGGAITLAAVGGLDAYVARLTAAGEARWVGRIGSAGDEGGDGPGTIRVSPRAEGGLVLTVGVGGAPAAYRIGGVTTGIGAPVVPAIGLVQIALELDTHGALLEVSVLGMLPTFRLVTTLLPIAGGAILTGGEIGLTPEGQPDPEGAPPRLFVERRDGATVSWSKLIAGSGAFIGSVPLLAYGVSLVDDELIVVGSFDGGDVVFDFGSPLSPAVSADGGGPRLFVARYNKQGNVLGGVTSPGGGVVPIDDWIYRTALRSEGAPDLIVPPPTVRTDSGLCLALPRVGGEGTGRYLPGAPWLADDVELEPVGAAGAAYCIHPARILGCGTGP